MKNPSPFRRAGVVLIVLPVVAALIWLICGCGDSKPAKAPVNPNAIVNTTKTVRAAITAGAEYEVQTDQVINHWGTKPIDWSKPKKKNAPGSTGTGLVDDPIERLVWAAYQAATSKHLLEGAPEKALVDSDGDGFLELLDGWANKLKYAAFNVPGHESYDAGLPQRGGADLYKSAQPFVSSAGPNGKWGAYDEQGKPDAQATDNIHSFNVD